MAVVAQGRLRCFGRRGRARRAFTMLEMITALLISVIMGSMAMAGFYIYEKQTPMDNAARKLAYVMSLARTQAIAHNTRFAVHVDLARKNFWIDQIDDADTVTAAKVEPVQAMDPRVDIFRVFSGTTELPAATEVTSRFFPDGSCDDMRMMIKLVDADGSSPDNVHTVRLYGPTGLAKIFEHQILTP